MDTIDHPPVRTHLITFDGEDKDSVVGYGWADSGKRTDTIEGNVVL